MVLPVPDGDPLQASVGGSPSRGAPPRLPRIPRQDLVRSHRPCRHCPLFAQCLFKSNSLSSDLRLSVPVTILPPLYDTTLPRRRLGQHLCTAERARSAALIKPVPPSLTTPIDALVTSARQTAPKHSARPLAHDDTLQPLDHPLWFSEMPPLNSAQKALVAQFVAATGANEKTAQRVR